MPGIGNSTFGSFPYGVGTPTTGEAPPTGEAGCRYLNPLSRDYEQDPETMQLAQMPGTRQRVLLALLTLKGSSSVLPAFGVRWPAKIDRSYEQGVAAAVASALHTLTTVEKVIRLQGTAVKRTGVGRVEITVSFVDLTTGAEDSASVAL